MQQLWVDGEWITDMLWTLRPWRSQAKPPRRLASPLKRQPDPGAASTAPKAPAKGGKARHHTPITDIASRADASASRSRGAPHGSTATPADRGANASATGRGGLRRLCALTGLPPVEAEVHATTARATQPARLPMTLRRAVEAALAAAGKRRTPSCDARQLGPNGEGPVVCAIGGIFSLPAASGLSDFQRVVRSGLYSTRSTHAPTEFWTTASSV